MTYFNIKLNEYEAVYNSSFNNAKDNCLLKYLKSYLMVMKYNFKCYARRKRDKTIEEYKHL